jgi:hypothetical protein
MNFVSLVSATVLSLAVTATGFAQSFSFGGGGVALGGSRNTVKVSSNKITTTSFGWNVGVGFGGGNGGFYRPAVYAPAVLPYYGGGCTPGVISYSPFTGCYGNPVYVPVAPVVPVPVCAPVVPVYGGCGQFTVR